MTARIDEKPIVFDANEVKAVLAGYKIQHRVPTLTSEQISAGYEWDFGADGDAAIFYKYDNDGISIEKTLLIDCPFGAIGDRLWVKEPFIPDPPADHDAWEDQDSVTNYFQWDGCGSKLSEIPKRLRKPEHVIYKASWDDSDAMIWVRAAQMRKWASRILLEITDISIERVQNVTHNDSVKEAAFTFYPKQAVPPLSAFPRYWMLKHGDDAWRLNPWVWVIEFKVIDDK